jgi:hypothetical protein
MVGDTIRDLGGADDSPIKKFKPANAHLHRQLNLGNLCLGRHILASMNGDRTPEIGAPVAILNVFAGVNDQPRPRLPDRNDFHFPNVKTRGSGVNPLFSSTDNESWDQALRRQKCCRIEMR